MAFSGWQRYVQPQQWIQLLHHAPSGMLLVGEDRVLRANLAAYLLLGIRLVGRHYLFSAEQSEESQQAFIERSPAVHSKSVPSLCFGLCRAI